MAQGHVQARLQGKQVRPPAKAERPPELMPLAPSRFDSSVGRGDFVVKIGVGQVIKGTFPFTASFPHCRRDAGLIESAQGWDEGVTQMQVGEKATLDISADFGYGARYATHTRCCTNHMVGR